MLLAPTGQLALVDAAITVMAGGTLVLRAVHVAQDVTVQPGGAVQNVGSLVRLTACYSCRICVRAFDPAD